MTTSFDPPFFTLPFGGISQEIALTGSSVNYPSPDFTSLFGPILAPRIYAKDLTALELASSGKVVVSLNDVQSIDFSNNTTNDITVISGVCDNAIHLLPGDPAKSMLLGDFLVDVSGSTQQFHTEQDDFRFMKPVAFGQGSIGGLNLSGDLSVSGDSFLLGSLSIANDLSIGGDAQIFGGFHAGADSTIQGALSVSDAGFFAGSLDASSILTNATVTTTLSVSDATCSTLQVDQGATIQSLSIVADTTIGGTLSVTGATSLAGSLQVMGDTLVHESAKLYTSFLETNQSDRAFTIDASEVTIKGNVVVEGSIESLSVKNMLVRDKQVDLAYDPDNPSYADGSGNDMAGFRIAGTDSSSVLIHRDGKAMSHEKSLLWHFGGETGWSSLGANAVNRETLPEENYWELAGGAFRMSHFSTDSTDYTTYTFRINASGDLELWRIRKEGELPETTTRVAKFGASVYL